MTNAFLSEAAILCMSGGSGIAGAAVEIFHFLAPAIVADHATATCQTGTSILEKMLRQGAGMPKK